MAPDELIRLQEKLEEERVQLIRVLFTDLLGELKSIEIPRERLAYAVEHGIAFDGSSVGGYAHIADGDMVLVPDLGTLTIHPGLAPARSSAEEYAVAAVIADVFTSAGNPFPGDPRCILRRLMGDTQTEGYRLFAGAELEFFLFPVGEIPEEGAHIQRKEGYFSRSLADDEAAVREEIVLTLLQMSAFRFAAEDLLPPVALRVWADLSFSNLYSVVGIRDLSCICLHAVLCYPVNFLEGGLTCQGLLQPVISQRRHTLFNHSFFNDMRTALPAYHLPDIIIDDQQLEDSRPSEVAGFDAAFAASAFIEASGGLRLF